MKIVFKTTTALAKYLPRNAPNNTAQIDIVDSATPEDVLVFQGLPAGINYLITVNDILVRPSERQTFQLSEGDTVSILPPLKGG